MKVKMSELIKKRKAVDKARVEYHSFISVRELHDIASSYTLMETRIRLEGNLVKASNDFDRAINSIK